MGEKYNLTDAAVDTDSSSRQTSEAWHDARDDSGVRSGDDYQQFQSTPDGVDPNMTTESGVPLFPERVRSDDEDSSSSGK